MQRWIAVFIRHNQSKSAGVLHSGNNLCVDRESNAESSQQAEKPECLALLLFASVSEMMSNATLYE